MEKRTVIALVVVAVLIVGAGIGGYYFGKSRAMVRTVEHTVTLPGQIIEAPGKIIPRPYPVADSAGLAERDAEISRLRAERDVAQAKLARYEETWVEMDTTLAQYAEIVTPGDSLVWREQILTRMNIRYGFPPVNRFVVTRPEESFKIRIPTWTPAVAAASAGEPGFLESTFGWIRDVLAVIGGLSLVGGGIYIATR